MINIGIDEPTDPGMVGHRDKWRDIWHMDKKASSLPKATVNVLSSVNSMLWLIYWLAYHKADREMTLTGKI